MIQCSTGDARADQSVHGSRPRRRGNELRNEKELSVSKVAVGQSFPFSLFLIGPPSPSLPIPLLSSHELLSLLPSTCLAVHIHIAFCIFGVPPFYLRDHSSSMIHGFEALRSGLLSAPCLKSHAPFSKAVSAFGELEPVMGVDVTR